MEGATAIHRGWRIHTERRTTDARSTAVWRCDGGAMAADGRGLRRQGGGSGAVVGGAVGFTLLWV